MRVPLFREPPTLRPPSGTPARRVLVILAPVSADVRGVKALARALRPAGVELVAASECHGEVRGERDEPLKPNLLLVEAGADWDAVVVAGGRGAVRVADDAFARALVLRMAERGRPVAAVGLGRAVLERAGVAGLTAPDAAALAEPLAAALGVSATMPAPCWFRRLREA